MSGTAWQPLAAEMALGLSSAALKGMALLALAAGLALALRRAPARVRHLLWGSSLLGLLLLPLLAPLLPAWSLGLLPSPVTAVGSAPHVAGVVPGDAGPGGRATGGMSGPPSPAVGEQLPELRPDSVAGGPGSTGSGAGGAAIAPVGVAGARGAARADPIYARLAPPPPASPGSGLPQLPLLIVGLWVVGFAAVLGAQATGLWRLAGLAATARPLPAGGSWQRTADRLARRLRLTRPVALRAGRAVRTPMTFGVRRPVILLPPTAAGWSAERRELVLLHELTHVRRGDWPVLLLARLAVAAHWLNPLAWRALGRLVAEQEAACDEAVLATGTRPSRYAAHLLAIARAMAPQPPRPLPALEMARSSQMEDRLMSILDFRRNDRPRNFRVLPVVALVLALAAGLAAVQPFAEAAPQSPSAGSEDLTAVLGELAALEARLEPYEARLEELEVELEPYEARLEEVEAEMEPVEAEINRFEGSLEPYEARLEEVERQLEPYEAELEQVEGGIEPYEARLEELEEQLEPYEQQLEQLEEQLAPVEEQMAALEEEMEPVHERMEALHEQMETLREAGELDSPQLEQLQAQMRQLEGELQPVHERMSGLHEQMRPHFEALSAVHEQMRPVHEQLAAIHEEMRPHFEGLSAVHERMRPVHEQLAAIHEEMRPHFEAMGQIHSRLEPFHAQMQAVHREMEPLHERMQEIHREMEPIHRELGRLHKRLERALQAELRALLEAELGGGGIPAAALDRAAGRILDSASVRVDDGRLRLLTSAAEVREILVSEVGDAAGPALDRAVAAVSSFEVAAPARP